MGSPAPYQKFACLCLEKALYSGIFQVISLVIIFKTLDTTTPEFRLQMLIMFSYDCAWFGIRTYGIIFRYSRLVYIISIALCDITIVWASLESSL